MDRKARVILHLPGALMDLLSALSSKCLQLFNEKSMVTAMDDVDV